MGLGGPTVAGEQGFSWGYLDLLDDTHSGIVVIWCFGLPFLPGTVHRGRIGQPVRPVAEPSVSIAVHRHGEPDLWLLQRLPPDARTPEPIAPDLQLGACRFASTPGRLEVHLDCPVPGGERLVGDLVLEGEPIRVDPVGASVHRWAPRLVGRGRADLACGDWRLTLDGEGYHDANASQVGLEQLGIRRWIWGRTPHREGTWIHYLIEPEDPAHGPQYWWIDVDRTGRVTQRVVEVAFEPDVPGRWGFPSPRGYTIEGRRFRHVHALEDGPFYQRWVTQLTTPDGQVHHGTGEVVDVPRMDASPLRHITAFAVHDPRRFSWWVPLFSGPPEGRLSRLLRHWRG